MAILPDKIRGGLVSLILKEAKGRRKSMTLFLKVLRDLKAQTFMLSVPVKDLFYEIVLSVRFKDKKAFKKTERIMKACLSDLFDQAIVKTIPEGQDLRIPIGNLRPRFRFKNSLVVEEGEKFRAMTFFKARKSHKKSSDYLDRNALEGLVRGLMRSGVFAIYNLILSPPSFPISLLNKDCWNFSCILTVLSKPMDSCEDAYSSLEDDSRIVKFLFSSAFPNLKLMAAGRWSVTNIARCLVERRQYLPEKTTIYEIRSLVEPPLIKPLFNTSRDLIASFFCSKDERAIVLGSQVDSGLMVKMRFEEFPGHVAVFGSAKSGKTMFMRRLAERYARLGGKVLIFDRFGEYKDLNGFKLIAPQQVLADPFELIEVNELEDYFSLIWPEEMDFITRIIVKKELTEFIDKARENFLKPSLKEFVNFLKVKLNPLAKKVYKGIDSFRVSLLISLLKEIMPKRPLKINVRKLGMNELMRGNFVLDLSSIPSSGEINIVICSILKFIHEYRKRNPCKRNLHVTLIDDVHDLTCFRSRTGAQRVERMLREMEKYGESVWIVSRTPSAIQAGILGQISAIICMKLGLSRDLDLLKRIAGLNSDQVIKLARLGTDEAMVFITKVNSPIFIKLEGGYGG
ncbi:hypothetical protein DRN86_02820 [Candidatus Geothermarchaeota archaeon]|nr:MAG: hypothetical protein DRN86_02820 [Candidatus Geothermarchaeota archaeon]